MRIHYGLRMTLGGSGRYRLQFIREATALLGETACPRPCSCRSRAGLGPQGGPGEEAAVRPCVTATEALGLSSGLLVISMKTHKSSTCSAILSSKGFLDYLQKSARCVCSGPDPFHLNGHLPAPRGNTIGTGKAWVLTRYLLNLHITLI